ncbi:MAG: SLC13 family permease [Alphaproteobacteria bacterium]|nr:SLC13 family permease [Alphaproteobacteria bacterium]
MNIILDPSFHMWFVLALTGVSVIAFIREEVPLEITSVGILTVLLLVGQLFPLLDAEGNNHLNAASLLAGFANPSLIAVLALLVMGQGMIHTDALRIVTNIFAINKGYKRVWAAILGILIFVMVSSAFLNNTPLVVIVIPLIQALAASVGMSESRVMIPLSFVAILGGMTTLIGSSTNLLVASAMEELGHAPLEFFDFVVPGMMMAGIGFLYVAFIAPYLLPDRSSMARDLAGGQKEFVAELDIASDSKLIGMECVEGAFPQLGNLNIKLIQRGGHLILPPFEGYAIEQGDILIVSATRKTLTKILSSYPGFLLSEEESAIIDRKAQQNQETSDDGSAETRILAELMITPASRMVDMSLSHIGLEKQFGVIILGIQRRARVVRRRLGRIRLEAGDVLLVAGRRSMVDSMRDDTDFIVLSGSKKELPAPGKAPIAGGIFLSVIVLAAMGILSIPVAAITGAVAMVATGCLNMRQAIRALDRKIYLLVGAMLALGVALQVTGGARYIAELILGLPFVDTPLTMVAVLFIIIAITTNILTNNACAILFTPIAMSLAASIEAPAGLAYELPFIFAVTVVFAANCSFASPIGYQTNLLVMGPGHYRFMDFIKTGVPLVLILWLAYILIAKYYFGL